MALIFIKTFGCAHNFADGEEMAYYLTQSGHQVFGLDGEDSNILDCDLIIYNTCTVKNPTDDKFFTLLKRTKKPVILAGCIPQSQRNEDWLKEYSAIGVDKLYKIVDVVNSSLEGVIVHELDKQSSLEKRTLPLTRKNKFVAIIPILQGCLGNCTYCKTKHARGHLKSYPKKVILDQVRDAKLSGVKEIWLVSEDNGAYGKDIGSNIVELLNDIDELINSSAFPMVRIGMLNPEYAFEFKVGLVDILKRKNFYEFLHIPIQAANDGVLKSMNRPYTKEQCESTFNFLKEHLSSISLGTDIICGFPTESPDQFLETLDFVKQFDFSMINISKFYPRPKTPAAKMKLIPTKEVKRRSKLLSDWFSSVNFNVDFIGKTLDVIFTEKGSGNSFVGKTKNYRQVIVNSDVDIRGEKLKVKINSITRDDLRGEIVN